MRISDCSSDVCSSDLVLLAEELFASGCRFLISMTSAGQLVAVRPPDRKSVGEGKSVSVRVDLGGRRIIKKKKIRRYNTTDGHIQSYSNQSHEDNRTEEIEIGGMYRRREAGQTK